MATTVQAWLLFKRLFAGASFCASAPGVRCVAACVGVECPHLLAHAPQTNPCALPRRILPSLQPCSVLNLSSTSLALPAHQPDRSASVPPVLPTSEGFFSPRTAAGITRLLDRILVPLSRISALPSSFFACSAWTVGSSSSSTVCSAWTVGSCFPSVTWTSSLSAFTRVNPFTGDLHGVLFDRPAAVPSVLPWQCGWRACSSVTTIFPPVSLRDGFMSVSASSRQRKIVSLHHRPKYWTAFIGAPYSTKCRAPDLLGEWSLARTCREPSVARNLPPRMNHWTAADAPRPEVCPLAGTFSALNRPGVSLVLELNISLLIRRGTKQVFRTKARSRRNQTTALRLTVYCASGRGPPSSKGSGQGSNEVPSDAPLALCSAASALCSIRGSVSTRNGLGSRCQDRVKQRPQ